MGMSVLGNEPSAPAGEHFYSRLLDWGPIHGLMRVCCSDLLDQKMLGLVGGNEGAGVPDQGTCITIADRIDEWLERHASEIASAPNLIVDFSEPDSVTNMTKREWFFSVISAKA